MAANFICELCHDHLFGGEAFFGEREGQRIISCFDCYLSELKTFTVGGETVRYNAPDRDIQAEDLVVFYDRDGRTLSKIPMHKLSADQVKPAKEAVAEESGIPVEHITLVIENHEHDVKDPV